MARKRKEPARSTEREMVRATSPWKDSMMRSYDVQQIVSITTSGNIYSRLKLRNKESGRLTNYHWNWSPTKPEMEGWKVVNRRTPRAVRY